MKLLLFKVILLTGYFFFSIHLTNAQSNPSAFTVVSDNLVVNTYYPGTTNIPAGGKIVQLGGARGAATQITRGDLILIIQMQGSDIDASNGANYGSGNGIYSGFIDSKAGNYEYALAANSIGSGCTLYLQSGTKNSYINANATSATGQYRYQVIRVPRYNSLTFQAGNKIIAEAWNGTTGGVVAFDVTGTMTVNGTFINVSTMGFRGGAGLQLGGTGGFSNTDVRATSTSNGSKGEGIAGVPKYVRTARSTEIINSGSETYPNGSNGMGAPGNAGGGGTDGNPGGTNNENAGGGGGGNGGTGGRGGRTWNSNLDRGGYGGVAPLFIAITRLILGGGGGAGSSNDGTGGDPRGIASSGGAGGGIVIVNVGAISGTGNIEANGENGGTPVNDGGGGGGAGGTVNISSTATTGLSNITITAKGGSGGNAWEGIGDAGGVEDGNPEHGPGGGGGGGVIYTNGTIHSSSSVAGGVNGITTFAQYAFGSTSGAVGVKHESAMPISLPQIFICSNDADQDGIPNINETSVGTDPWGDIDSDGIPNIYDGITAVTDLNNDGINDAYDTDRDGVINALDLDSDNDGIPDALETGEIDIDGDGIKNFLDLDSDGDGILDSWESGLNHDSNRDGVVSSGDAGYSDHNNDGWADMISSMIPFVLGNTDGLGNPDYLDIDSDEDGITDNVEGQSLNPYETPSKVDADGDGIDNAYDNDDGTFAGDASNGIIPEDTDNDQAPDYQDSDSDGDSDPDIIEGNDLDNDGEPDDDIALLHTDTDGDGLDDFFEIDVNNGPDVTIAGLGGTGSKSRIQKTSLVSEHNRDWRNVDLTLSPQTILPVEFISFIASRQSTGVQLSWTVTSEDEVKYYQVEKSTDGRRYHKIGELPFKSEISMVNKYMFYDGALASNTVYYRIRQVDMNGKFMFSGVVSVCFNESMTKLSIYPNPVLNKGSILLGVKDHQRAEVVICDIQGHILKRRSVELQKGQNVIAEDLFLLLPGGTYIMMAEVDGMFLQTRVIKQ